MTTVPPWLVRAVTQTDWFRRPPSRVGGRPMFKEWHHFCVYGVGWDLLVNFSEVDDPRGPDHPPIGRLTVLGRRTGWTGDVVRVPHADLRIRAGGLSARYGRSAMSYRDGVYHLVVEPDGVPIRADLELAPMVMPAPVYNVGTGDGPPIHWVVLPRLTARGWVEIEGQRSQVDGSPAYHDHNWGHFRWGRDFAWEWGFGLPQSEADPWSFVFARLSDRRLTRTRMQTLFLWRGQRVHRAFRDAQIRIRHHGLMRPSRLHKVPAVMGLVSRGLACDVPERMTLEAESPDSTLFATFVPNDVAQVVLPNDEDAGVTIINEVAGDLQVEARIAGEDVHITCPTIFEFLGA